MVVVEDDKSQLRAQTQLVQSVNGQILQVQVPANNNNNNTNTNNNMKQAGQQQVEVADGSEDQGAVAQQTGATTASAAATDHSIHRWVLPPLSPPTTRSRYLHRNPKTPAGSSNSL